MPKPNLKDKREKQIERPYLDVELVPRKPKKAIEQSDVTGKSIPKRLIPLFLLNIGFCCILRKIIMIFTIQER